MSKVDYKHKIALYCKSYRGDIRRAEILYESVQKYNKDNIPFYFQIPKSDYELWKNTFGTEGHEIIFDEDVTDLVNNQSHFTQQLYKMEFYKTRIAEYYIIVDSDFYFIKEFTTEDFISPDGIPYLIMHEDKAMREYSVNIFGNHNLSEWWDGNRRKVKEYFGRPGKIYGYSGSALIYFSEALRTLYEELCEPQGSTFLDLLNYRAKENAWHGEWILYKKMPFLPSEPLFKIFHYEFQYKLAKQLGHTEESYAQMYIGIGLQSNWNAPLRY